LTVLSGNTVLPSIPNVHRLLVVVVLVPINSSVLLVMAIAPVRGVPAGMAMLAPLGNVNVPSIPNVKVDVELPISVFNITVPVDIIKGVSIAPTVTPLVLSNGF